MWVRGLKHVYYLIQLYCLVAPRVGAWIETLPDLNNWHQALSHPVWVRGLKLTCPLHLALYFVVAPRVGAWIETVLMYQHDVC